MIFRAFYRLSLGMQFGLLLTGLVTVVAIAGNTLSQSIVASQVVNEGRSVADMTEYIGTWASQYGGIHVKTKSTNPKDPGSYLERYTYLTAPSTEHGANKGSTTPDPNVQPPSMDMYFWKNPALIQREVSDVAYASPSKVKFRITAPSVLNQRNQPNDFEKEAMDSIWAAMAANKTTLANPSSSLDSLMRKPTEYWKINQGQLQYARVMIASNSCLRCHGDKKKAPDFLRMNSDFNAGGGFGYQEGAPAGIISVTIPMPRTMEALAASLTPTGWASMIAIVVFGILILVFIARKVIRPINQLRIVAEALSNTAISPDFAVPDIELEKGKTSNEVHRLARSVFELGESVKILFRKMRENRNKT